MSELLRVREAAEYVAGRTELRPEVGLILGSGLGGLADEMEDATAIPYPSIPHFPASTVPGHKGRLVVGRLAGTPVYAMQGRFHFYRSEEHTSELQSRENLVCRLLLEKKKQLTAK